MMDNVKKILGIYAGGVGGVVTSLVAATVFAVSAPVALAAGFAVAGASAIAALSKED